MNSRAANIVWFCFQVSALGSFYTFVCKIEGRIVCLLLSTFCCLSKCLGVAWSQLRGCILTAFFETLSVLKIIMLLFSELSPILPSGMVSTFQNWVQYCTVIFIDENIDSMTLLLLSCQSDVCILKICIHLFGLSVAKSLCLAKYPP